MSRVLNHLKMSALKISGAIRVAYSFTSTDHLTTMVPALLYAIISTPKFSAGRMLQAILWVWFHILQTCTANQMLGVLEDTINKPHRPIPAGRISVGHTKILRYSLVPVCLGLSWLLGVARFGMVFAVGIWVYNELGLSGASFYTRNVLNSVGIVALETGAAEIVAGGAESVGPSRVHLYPVTALLIATTIHVQDFRDVAGDRKQGRTTLPIAMPESSRTITLGLMICWSAGLTFLWGRSLSFPTAMLFLGLGVYVGGRIYFLRTEPADQVSFKLYMVWLAFAQILPLL
ncbi:UbiA prenyltransferase family [Mycena belliarum]|uniref:UbiA prenyltransferase family n=1 Tax=Mycena belliarum TaxID=1033014 RepID=A0AAD6U3Y0_9AGAR|nr:UbiA prenyltransferase family [Mycena belliae]